ncbi:hypothetical protein EG329_009446 [Mollisiaceae sp. DMI_Dod_QoI]|nr:hypothetical protein EG329_009446 [Helotiales sp. DMI_Dod_QoI]
MAPLQTIPESDAISQFEQFFKDDSDFESQHDYVESAIEDAPFDDTLPLEIPIDPALKLFDFQFPNHLETSAQAIEPSAVSAKLEATSPPQASEQPQLSKETRDAEEAQAAEQPQATYLQADEQLRSGELSQAIDSQVHNQLRAYSQPQSPRSSSAATTLVEPQSRQASPDFTVVDIPDKIADELPDEMASSPSPVPDLTRNRLPTLFEVLARRTLAPVDLYFYYIYMRDQQRSVDYLDFWLDVAQHTSICRHYVRELRRSVLVATPEGDKSGSKRSSALLENLGNLDYGVAGPSMMQTDKERNKDAQMSAFLREDGANGNGNGLGQGHSPSGSNGSNVRQGSNDRPRPSFMSSPQVLTSDSNSPAHTVSRADIRASAEKILYTYLLPQAEREIYLPPGMMPEIAAAIEQRGRDDPEVFDGAKDFVFQALERDSFPRFLRAKALGNLVPPSIIMRLIVGLLSLFGGFWAGFVLIFLDSPRHERLYLILPFTLGCYCLTCFEYVLDPVIVLAGFSEYSFFGFSKIHEPGVLAGSATESRAEGSHSPHYGVYEGYAIWNTKTEQNPR